MRRPTLGLPGPLARWHLRRQPSSSPAELLGPNHPLARGEEFRRDLWRQSLLTAAALLLSAIATASGRSWGLPFLIALAIVQLALVLVLALHALLQRERARELIIDGRISLPLPVLEREQRRLQARRRAADLAVVLEDLVSESERWRPVFPSLRPIVDPRQVRAAAAELHAIAARLLVGDAPVQAVARVERLLASGDSALYDQEPEALRQELRRIQTDLERSHPSERAGERSLPQGRSGNE
jgi:hypothetical protein